MAFEARADFDMIKLSSSLKNQELYVAISSNVGFALPNASCKPIAATSDNAAGAYVDSVDAIVAALVKASCSKTESIYPIICTISLLG